MADFPRLPPETTRPDQTVLCRHASGRPTRDPAPRSSPGPSGLPLPSGTFFPRRLSALAPIYDAHFTTGAIEQQLVHMPPGRQKKASPIGRVLPEALPRLPSQAIARPHDAATLGNRARVEPRLDPTHTVLAVEAGGQRIDDVFLGGKLRIREKSPKILPPGGTGGHNMPPARHRAAKAPRASARSAKKRARSEACPSAPRSGILHSSCRRSAAVCARTVRSARNGSSASSKRPSREAVACDEPSENVTDIRFRVTSTAASTGSVRRERLRSSAPEKRRS